MHTPSNKVLPNYQLNLDCPEMQKDVKMTFFCFTCVDGPFFVVQSCSESALTPPLPQTGLIMSKVLVHV